MKHNCYKITSQATEKSITHCVGLLSRKNAIKYCINIAKSQMETASLTAIICTYYAKQYCFNSDFEERAARHMEAFRVLCRFYFIKSP